MAATIAMSVIFYRLRYIYVSTGRCLRRIDAIGKINVDTFCFICEEYNWVIGLARILLKIWKKIENLKKNRKFEKTKFWKK